MTGVDPNRYLAWYEMAQVHLRRRQLREAKAALEQYLRRTPQRDLQAEQTWRMLDNMTQGQ
jgi:Tfp pilus assembly protein PilF